MNQGRAKQAVDFDRTAHSYDEMVAAGHPLYARYNDVLTAVVDRANLARGKVVLDIGAGTGNLARLCLSRGASFVGIDPSLAMLAAARQKLRGCANVELLKADAPFLRIPFPASSFDAVTSTYAFHHVPRGSHVCAISEMLRVLKPGRPWVLGDLAFENTQAEQDALRRFRWLEAEQFLRIDEARLIFARLGAILHARQFTPVTWVLWAAKPEAVPGTAGATQPGALLQGPRRSLRTLTNERKEET